MVHAATALAPPARPARSTRPGSPPIRSALIAMCLACLALLACTAAASADTSGSEEITFQENLASDNSALTDQYEAGYGVEFDTPTPSGDSLGFPGNLPMTECGATLLTNGFYKPGSPPIVILASRSGGDEGCKSSSEFFGPDQGLLFHVDDARASLSLLMRAFPQQSNQLSAITGATAVAYRADGTVLDEVKLDAAEATQWTSVNLSTADPDGIQFVAIYGEIDIGAAVGVQIDNLKLPEAAKTTQPAFRVTESQQGRTGDLVEGDTLDIPIQIVRENGSTGTVTVNATPSEGAAALSRVAVNQSPAEEPPGVALVELTAQRGQAGKSVTIVVNGTGNSESGSQDGASLTYTFAIEQDLVLVTSTSASVAQSCQDPFGLELQVAGATPMNVEILTSDGFTQDIVVTGRGQYPIADTLRAAYTGGATSEQISLTASQIRTNNFLPAFAQASLGVTLERPEPRVTLSSGDYYTTSPNTFAFSTAQTQISMQGSGLPCHELVLDVGDDAAPTPSFTPTGTGSASVTDPVPTLATAPSATAPVSLSVVDKSNGTAIDGLPIYLVDFRADDGLHFLNDVIADMQWSDMEHAYGSEVNDCALSWCWHDPVAEGWFKWIQGQQPSGLCFGYTMLATEFYKQGVLPQSFGASSVGALRAPTNGTITAGKVANYPTINDEAPLGQALLSGWLSQFDAKYHLLENGENGDYASMPELVKGLSAALAQDGAAIVDINEPQAGEGHSVVAYGLEPGPGGIYTVDVYNPNIGYADPTELGSPLESLPWAGEDGSLGAREVGLAESQLILYPAGSTPEWKLTGAPGWSGNIENIGLTTLAQRPLHPELLTLHQIANTADQLLFSGVGGASGGAGSSAPAATVAKITAHGKDLLGAQGAPLKGSGVKLAFSSDGVTANAARDYVLPAGRTYTVATHTLRRGDFGMLVLNGGDGAGVQNATAVPGATDSLTLRPGSPAIDFSGASGSPVTLELIGGQAGAGRRTAMLTLSSGAGATSASLGAGGQLVVHHSGASTHLSLQLFSGGVAVGTSTIPLSGGSSVSLTPHWSALAGSVSATIGGRHVKLSLSSARGGALSKLLDVKRRQTKKTKKPKKHKKR
jgi:hypothetical protein